MNRDTEERSRVPGWMVLLVAFAFVALVAVVLVKSVR